MISGDSEEVGAPYCQERLSQDSGDNVARSWNSWRTESAESPSPGLKQEKKMKFSRSEVWWLTDASVFLSPFYNILELGV